ncbi:MAG: hypothetical protein ABJB39_06890 [Chloroflexota bacterium]
MFGLNLIPPLVRTAFLMLLVGGLIGYVGTAFTTTLVVDSGILGGGGESNDAHKYMIALLQRQSESLSQLRPASDVVSRALDQQNVSQAAQDVKPLSVTYLGGSSSGRLSVHIYAVELQAGGGQYQFFPLALTIVGGKVVRVE